MMALLTSMRRLVAFSLCSLAWVLAHGYENTAYHLGSNATRDLHIYTGSIRSQGSTRVFNASFVLNLKGPSQDGTRSQFVNATYHCDSGDRREVTYLVHTGHKELWGQGEQTFNTSRVVGQRLALNPDSLIGFSYDFVCKQPTSAAAVQAAQPQPATQQNSADSGPTVGRTPAGACNPQADPDRWHRCHIAYDDVQLYRQSSPDVVRRLDRALRIADPAAPFWRLEFLNGVVVSINSEKINSSRYSAAEKARLEGDVARAIQLERNAAVEQAQAQKSLEHQLAEQSRVLRQQCRGVPAIQAAALEEFSNFLRVNPAKIELNRVEFDEVWSACRGIFWHPSGTSRCTIRFDAASRVRAISDCRN